MMEFWSKNKVLAALIYTALGLLILYLLILIRPILAGIYDFLKAVLTPFIIAMIISYVLNPIVRILNHRKMPRTVAVLLIYAVFITAVVVILMNLTPMFVRQLNELNEHMPEITAKAQDLFDGFSKNRTLPQSVRDGILSSMAKMEDSVALAISSFINNIGGAINAMFVGLIIPFLAFYMMKDYQLIEKTALAIVPKSRRQQTIKLLVDIDTALGNYIRGQFMVCLIVGLLSYIGYWIIGVPYPLLLAFCVAVFNIIPYLGPFFGALPALLMASTVSIRMMVLVIVVNLIVQNLEGNVISPQVVGRTLKMHPMMIIFALLVGGEVAGVVGLILAVPMFAVLKVILQHLFLYIMHRRTIT